MDGLCVCRANMLETKSKRFIVKLNSLVFCTFEYYSKNQCAKRCSNIAILVWVSCMMHRNKTSKRTEERTKELFSTGQNRKGKRSTRFWSR